jgi:hypothetical protein
MISSKSWTNIYEKCHKFKESYIDKFHGKNTGCLNSSSETAEWENTFENSMHVLYQCAVYFSAWTSGAILVMFIIQPTELGHSIWMCS